MADMELQSAILQSALEALDGEAEADADAEDRAQDSEPGDDDDDDDDAMDVEANEDAEAEAEADAEADADAQLVAGTEGAGVGVGVGAGTGGGGGGGGENAGGFMPVGDASSRNQMLPPPHGKQFDTRDAVESYLKVYCNQQGYSVSCRRCVAKGVRGWKAVFYCNRGRPGDTSREKPAKNTKKIGCPMTVNVDCLQRTSFRWTIDTSMTLPHNHGPAVKTPRPVVPFPRRRKTRDVPREKIAARSLEGRRAMITGADPGIGRSIAVLFAREGADVTIVYLSHEEREAERTKRMVEAEGRTCLLIPGDIMDSRACKGAVEIHVNRFGMISVLVNNMSNQTLCDDITQIDLDTVEATFRTTVLHMFAITKYAVPHIERGGSIINTTSTQATRGSPTAVDYSASHGAVVSFTKSLDKQLTPKGIRVNAIALPPVTAPNPPAQVPSRPALERRPEVDSSGMALQIGDSIRRKEAARLFVFLAGLESAALSGQVLTALPVEEE